MHTNFIWFRIWIMTSLVRRNYSTESKTLYCTLVLFSVPDVELIWQQCHHHLTQLHQFLSINNFDLSENKVIFIYIHFFHPWHSVHWGIKKHHPIFYPRPLLNLKTVQAPLFYAIPHYIFVFPDFPSKNQIFQWTPLILKFFILNPIPSFKSI